MIETPMCHACIGGRGQWAAAAVLSCVLLAVHRSRCRRWFQTWGPRQGQRQRQRQPKQRLKPGSQQLPRWTLLPQPASASIAAAGAAAHAASHDMQALREGAAKGDVQQLQAALDAGAVLDVVGEVGGSIHGTAGSCFVQPTMWLTSVMLLPHTLLPMLVCAGWPDCTVGCSSHGLCALCGAAAGQGSQHCPGAQSERWPMPMLLLLLRHPWAACM
jgi:hypothetical protein